MGHLSMLGYPKSGLMHIENEHESKMCIDIDTPDAFDLPMHQARNTDNFTL